MAKNYRWQNYLKKGNLYLKNFKYFDAKLEFSKALDCKNMQKIRRLRTYLLRIITNFNLKGKNYLSEIRFDERHIPISTLCFESCYLNILRLDQSGEYDAAFKIFEENLIPHFENELDELIIHLSEELKVIYKIYHY